MGFNLNEEQTAKVIESLKLRLEDALVNGEKLTWNSFLSQIGEFFNASTKKAYTGFVNGIMLSFTSMAFGGDPRFVGYGQARKMGGSVKKGEKENLLPYIVGAVESKATVEEIMGTIRTTLGMSWDPWGYRTSPFGKEII